LAFAALQLPAAIAQWSTAPVTDQVSQAEPEVEVVLPPKYILPAPETAGSVLIPAVEQVDADKASTRSRSRDLLRSLRKTRPSKQTSHAVLPTMVS